jgi:hypothetical protein
MESGILKLEEIYDRIEAEENMNMGEADDYRWGIDYLNDILNKLEKLEEVALSKKNPILYNNIQLSIQRARQARNELHNKLTDLKK